MKERTKAEYRSSLRSKELIKEAYLKKLQEKPTEKITVTDIVSLAKINRGTFYAHYNGIGELTQALENEFCEELFSALKKLDKSGGFVSPLDTLLEISAFLEKNEEQYKTLAKLNKADGIISKLQSLFTEYMENNQNIGEEIKNSPGFKLRSHFFATGVTGAYISYFKDELDIPLPEIAKILSEIIVNDSLLF